MKKNSGKNWQEILDGLGIDKYPTDGCGECGEPWERRPDLRCICNKPMMISIPAGQHIHVWCPVHGDIKIYGPRYTLTGRETRWSYSGESTIKVRM